MQSQSEARAACRWQRRQLGPLPQGISEKPTFAPLSSSPPIKLLGIAGCPLCSQALIGKNFGSGHPTSAHSPAVVGADYSSGPPWSLLRETPALGEPCWVSQHLLPLI